MANAPKSTKTSSTFELEVPGTDKKVGIELELVPGDSLPETVKVASNAAKIDIGGKEFFAIAGKTHLA